MHPSNDAGNQDAREDEEDTHAWWGLLKLLIMCHTNENKEVITNRIKDAKPDKPDLAEAK